MPRKFTLKYGFEEQSVLLPDDYKIKTLYPKETNSQLSEDEIVKIRLNNPLAAPKLETILNNKDRVLLVVPDKTRVTRLDLIFPYLIKLFEQKNISDHQIQMKFALVRIFFGAPLFKSYRDSHAPAYA